MIDAAMLDDPAGRIRGMVKQTNNDSHGRRLKGGLVEDAAPCDGCELAPKCATGFACQRFAEWVRSGRDKEALSRVPNRGNFVRMFLEPKSGPIPKNLVARRWPLKKCIF
jgi:hypothetical protein